jgi:hypothetical protein
LWGDTGIEFFPAEPSPTPYSLCPDGDGGCFIAASFSPGFDSDLWLQHVDAQGQLPWGPEGVLVYGDPYTQRYPVLASDAQGGCYIAWEDWRPPYSSNEATFMNRVNSSGQLLWGSSGLFVLQGAWFKQLISDGQGGVMLHTSGNVYEWNDVYRFNPSGSVLWQLESVSKYYWANMIAGEPGYFYIMFTNENSEWAQRLDLSGNTHWPTLGSTQGVPLEDNATLISALTGDCYYRSPYFYAVYTLKLGSYSKFFYAQKLDSSGQRHWGDDGTLLTHYIHNDFGGMHYVNCCPDELGGVVATYEIRLDWSNYDVMAKRCNADGSLGGPFPLDVTLTPHNPPIQIPVGGGNFLYDLAIADTTPVAGLIDAWIEVTLPSGSNLDLLVRSNISIHPGQVLSRTNLQQFVPAAAPPGTYTYTLYAGDYDYNSPWGQDSFTFEKLSGTGPLQIEDTCWALNGFFDNLGEGVSGPAPKRPLQLLISPNPFNQSTSISFALSRGGPAQLSVYDVSGREVTRLQNGHLPAGAHTFTWRASECPSAVYVLYLQTDEGAISKKLLLLK